MHASHVDEQSLGSADHPKASATSASATLPWDELAAGLRGRLIGPVNPGYPAARLVYDPRFDDVRPRAIVMAATPDDVARTILFARDHDLAFAAGCGGHSYGVYSLSDGIVIDVSEMATIRPSTDRGTVTIGAGAKVIDVAAGLAAGGEVIPVETCATVGISGLTLGGGQGVVGRRFGLTCASNPRNSNMSPPAGYLYSHAMRDWGPVFSRSNDSSGHKLRFRNGLWPIPSCV